MSSLHSLVLVASLLFPRIQQLYTQEMTLQGWVCTRPALPQPMPPTRPEDFLQGWKCIPHL